MKMKLKIGLRVTFTTRKLPLILIKFSYTSPHEFFGSHQKRNRPNTLLLNPEHLILKQGREKEGEYINLYSVYSNCDSINIVNALRRNIVLCRGRFCFVKVYIAYLY